MCPLNHCALVLACSWTTVSPSVCLCKSALTGFGKILLLIPAPSFSCVIPLNMLHSSHFTVVYNVNLSLMFSHIQDIFDVRAEFWCLGVLSFGTQ